jgi:hypothetical protein
MTLIGGLPFRILPWTLHCFARQQRNEGNLRRTTMTLRQHSRHGRAQVTAIALLALVVAASISGDRRAFAQTQPQTVEPDKATKARLQNIVNGILLAWDKADVVCLGEDHGSKNDSDLRITLVEHPDFVRKVKAVIVEFADSNHQDVLDRLALDGEDIPREQLRALWKDTSGMVTWESPIYEAFLRAVRKVNLALPRDQRLRLIAGDNSNERNRGKFIHEQVVARY